MTVIDKNPEAFFRYPPGDGATTVVGLGFDRDVLMEAGIDAFVAVSSGDNSNIVSARVALENFHVPKVVARIYDPRRADIYERLNIPTVATTRWGVKQIQLMLFHDRQEIRETLGGGELLRMRMVAPHMVGKPVMSFNVPGKILLAGVSRGGGGFLPTEESTLQAGDYLVDAHQGRHGRARRGLRAGRGAPLMRVIVTGGGAVGRHLSVDLVERGHEVTLIEQDRGLVEKLQAWAPKVNVMHGDACEPTVLEDAALRPPTCSSRPPVTTRTTS